MHWKAKCSVCDSTQVNKFLERFNVPVHQNLVLFTEKNAKEVDFGELVLFFCNQCGFIFNGAFHLDKLQYGHLYDNTQELSAVFQSYISSLVDYLIRQCGIRNKKIVEVGCGNGSFLKKIVLASESTGFGFDPSYAGEESCIDGRVTFFKKFYDASCASTRADIVICRHVIEHVPRPVELFMNIKHALVDSPDALVFFETPDVEWILRKKVFYDLFYEHCSYFSCNTIVEALQAAGFYVHSVQNNFNGQYLWVLATVQPGQKDSFSNQCSMPNQLKHCVTHYSHQEKQIMQRWKGKIKRLRAKGKVSVWGAGAKGSTFVNIVDPKGELIDSLIDINPNKQGCYVAGTGHPIIGCHEILHRKPASIIVMNPNYTDEIKKIVAQLGLSVELINWEA